MGGKPFGSLGTPTTRASLKNFIDKYGVYGADEFSIKIGSGDTVRGRVYYLDTNGAWKLTNASSNVAGSDQLIAIAKGTVPTTHGMMLRGITNFYLYEHLGPTISNYNAGKAIYLATISGRLNVVAPQGSGQIVRIAGHCLALDPSAGFTGQQQQIYFNPEPGWLELV